MNRLFILLLVFLCWSCAHNPTEKYQDKRDNVIDVHNKVKEIKTEPILFHNMSRVYIIDDYLLIVDLKSYDKYIHLFNKHTFRYVTSIAPIGQGPGEIAHIGYLSMDEARRRFYVNDYGKQRIFRYDLDSVLTNPSYMPESVSALSSELFPEKYQFINDSLVIGLIVGSLGPYDFKNVTGTWNINTGETKLMKDHHPEIEKKRIYSTASMKYGLYAECHERHDLMTICTLDGDLKFNIYGKDRSSDENKYNIRYYQDMIFCGDKIIAIYSKREHDEILKYPTQCLVFDINGDYIATLDIGYEMSRFCYDEDNNRLIFSMDDDIQFGYLDLDEVF